MMQQGIFLLAFDPSGELIGSVYVEIRGTRGYFGMLAISPARQGTGIGRILVQAAEDYSGERGCQVMDISVLSLRPELPPLYRKLGYTETGKEEFHPRNPLKPGLECHSIVMSKTL
jgi:ribosomal protein S18 acetylase RimI-like enzyme